MALDYLVDTLLEVEKLRVAAQVRETHLEKQGRQDEDTAAVRDRLKDFEDWLTKKLKGEMEAHPTWEWLSTVKGVGLENAAKVVGIIEGTHFKNTGEGSISAFHTMSQLRAYAGLAPVEGKAERRERGKKLGYNSELRVMLYRLATSLLKAQGAFYEYYQEQKLRYQQRFAQEGKQVLSTPSAFLCQNCGKLSPKLSGASCCPSPHLVRVKREEPEGVIWAGHLHAMALRKVMTMFQDMLYLAWRRKLGLSWQPSYIAGKEPVRQHLPEDFSEKPEAIDKAKPKK